MKVLIINPPIRLSDKPRNIPHGLAILANIIRKELNITPSFVDINARRYSWPQVESILEETEYDVVLIGGLAPVYSSIIKLIGFIKKIKPKVKIIVGGSVAMSASRVLMENSKTDIICMGEGEFVVVELLRKLQEDINSSLEDIDGICYRSKENKIIMTKQRALIKDLDSESALPAYDLLDMEIYLSNPVVGLGRDIDFISSRGCPYQCTFCYQPWGNQIRFHSVDFVIEAISMLVKKYRIDFISFQDDEFMANKKRVYEFCEKKQRYFPDLLWSCTGRANIVKDEIIKVMKDSGCVLISYGFESGSQKMLDKMRKMQTIRQMEKVVELSRKNDMPVPVSFIIGMPGETEETCEETLQFCLRNNIPLYAFMFAMPYPGTVIFDYALKTGRIEIDRLHEYILRLGDARDFTVNLTDDFTNDELIHKRESMMLAAEKNYLKYISSEQIVEKTRKLFGKLVDKSKMSAEELRHRAIHGGMSIF